MDIARPMIHVQQVDEDKLKDKKKFCSKRVKATNHEFGQQKTRNGHRSSFQQRSFGLAPSSASVLHQEIGMIRGIRVLRISELRTSHFMREFPKNRQGNEGNRAQSSLAALAESNSQRTTTSGTYGGTNCLYAIASCQDLENSPDVVTGMVRVSLFDPYVAIKFGINSEQLLEPFSVSTPSVPVVSEFLKVFLDDLPGFPHIREVSFRIDILPDTQPVSIPPYRMTSVELKEQLRNLIDKGFI
ncbi:uncharacterized protein LOC125845704 [Solanum stenotomum]|uniref:uncharacterized protein LOC125845704 n=1 Tax=Solanum stenotomum TaxID=172797 RepID=UPI0020D1B3D0|nr:uncharacterized protein LOC125845704 [Solanum stenotomum]